MRLVWLARYADGQYVTQMGGVPLEKMGRHNLTEISLLASSTKKILTIKLKPGQIVFYRRRVAMQLGAEPQIVHCIGYKCKTNDSGTVAYVKEDDWHVEFDSFRLPSDVVEVIPEELVEITWD